MKYGLNEAVAKYIIYAQISSDAGKHKSRVHINNKQYEDVLFNQGYDNKTEFIWKAIKLIQKSHGKSGFNYYCEDKCDQNGYASVITYFSFKLNGTRYQMSFHTPWNEAERYCLDTLCNKGTFKCHWNKDEDSSYRIANMLSSTLNI